MALRLSIKKDYPLFLLFLLGFGIVAVQLIPTYELMKLSHISPGNSFEVIEKFLVPAEHLITILIPNFFGSPSTYNDWGKVDYIQSIAYIGILPVFLSLYAVINKKTRNNPTVIFFSILTLISIVLALDWPVARAFYKIPIPIISTGAPSRIFFMVTFCLAILGGLGFDNLVKSKRLSRGFIATSSIVVLSTLLILAAVYYEYKHGVLCRIGAVFNCREVTLRNTILASVFFFAQFGILTIHLKYSGESIVKNLTTGLLVFTIIISGIYNTSKYLPSTPTKDLFPTIPVISALQNYTTDARVFGLGNANLVSDLATQFQIYDPEYYHPLYILRYRELLEYSNSGKYRNNLDRGDASITSDIKIEDNAQQRRDRLLDLLSVNYLLYKKEEAPVEMTGNPLWENNQWLMYKRENALPRAYMVNNIRIANSSREILDVLFSSDFSPKNSVVLEENVRHSTQEASTDGQSVQVNRYSAQEVDIKYDSPVDAFLVLTDNYYPGWNAYIDGEKTPVYRANYTLRAIATPKGGHLVSFKYEPRSVQYGTFFSLVSLGVYATLIIRYQIKKKSVKKNGN